MPATTAQAQAATPSQTRASGTREGGRALPPELAAKLANMSEEERKAFMQQRREMRAAREAASQ